MKNTVKRFLSIILVLALALSGIPGVFSPAERSYAEGNAASSSANSLYQVEFTREDNNLSFIFMGSDPVLLSSIFRLTGLKDKKSADGPSFNDSGFTVTAEGTDWKISYSGNPAGAEWAPEMTVKVGSTTYTYQLKYAATSGGTWVNKPDENAVMTWSYDAASKTLTLSGTGKLNKVGQDDDFGLDKTMGGEPTWIPEVPWKAWINDIEKIVIEEGITSIGDQAFRKHTALTTVEIKGHTLTKLGKCAFMRCTNLTTLDLTGCTSLTDIGQNATANEAPFLNSGLTTVLLSPATVSLPKKLFNWGNSNVSSVNLSQLVNLENIQENAFKKEDTSAAITDSEATGGLNLNKQTKLVTIGQDAFRNQTGLNKNLVIASPVLETIEQGAFSAWKADYGVLESVDLSACTGLKTIGYEAFLNQANLASVKFPDAFTWIDKDAFENCGLSLPTASIAYCVGGNGALYNVNADGSAALAHNATGNTVSDTLYWIPTAIASEFPYTDATQALVNGPTLCPETGSYSITYTLNGSSVSGIPSAKDPGTYAVGYTVTLPDGTTTQSGTISVTIAQPTAITVSMLSLDQASFEYDGSSHTPVLTVNDGTADLVKDTDYTIDTTSVTSAEDIGTYTISVTGKGGYTGTASISWEIKDTTAPVISGVTDNATYTEAANFSVSDLLLSSVTLQKDSETAQDLPVSGTTVSDTVSENGTYTIVVKDTSGNTATVTFTVAIPAQLTNGMLSLDQASFEYDGSSHTPVLTVNDGTTDLVKDTDYTVDTTSVTSAENVGSYTISVTGMGGYAGTASISWKIEDTTAPVISGVIVGTTYTEATSFSVSDLLLSSVTLQKDSETAQDLTVSGGSASGTASENGTYTIVAKDTSGNTATVTFTVAIPEPGTDPEPPVVTQAETPVFDPAGGSFRESVEVTITCGTPGATIRYTTDGTDPDAANGTVYTSGSAITLTRSTTLKAIAIADGYTDSEIASAAFSKRKKDKEEIPGDDPPQTDPFPFTDVTEEDYAREAVEWAVDNGITSGTTPTTFSPKDDASRSQVITSLWLAAGSPEPVTTENPFTDVSESDYFYKAVLWAYENGITSGISSDLFGSDVGVTRGQAVTLLWAAAGSPEPTMTENPFADVSEDDYFYKAVLWAYENGITVGTGAATFSPDAECLREQIITFLYLTYGKE